MQSCDTAAQWYCQIFSVKSVEEKSDVLFSNDDIKISYNFWSEGGTASFWVENNTTEDIYLDLSKCFFVNNGVVFDYYKNRIFGQSFSRNSTYGSSTSSSFGTNASNSFTYPQNFAYSNSFTTYSGYNTSNVVSYDNSTQVYYVEEKVLCIPANSCRRIECEHPIYGWTYRDCNLFMYDERDKNKQSNVFPKSSTFNQNNSPIVFKNIITYYVAEEKPEQMRKVTNEFYVDKITNYKQEQMFEIRKKDTSMCGKEYNRYYSVNLEKAPNKFYHRYTQSVYTVDGH